MSKLQKKLRSQEEFDVSILQTRFSIVLSISRRDWIASSISNLSGCRWDPVSFESSVFLAIGLSPILFVNGEKIDYVLFEMKELCHAGLNV
jgi:hypothetical protein